MKFRKNKKGFTIVELIIVIAVIGILTAVMVPTIVHLVNKANKASDESLVSNLNKAVALRQAETGKAPVTMFETVEGLREYGYNVDALVAKSDEALLYDLKANKFYLEGSSEVDQNKPLNYWKVQKSVETGQKYNIYAMDNFNFGSVTSINVGFDAGNSNVSEVNYVDASNPGHEVVIRTNSSATELNVDAPLDTVRHFGVAGVVDIASIAATSYHENGTVSLVKIKNGRLVVTEEAEIAGVHVVETNGNYNGIKVAVVGNAQLPSFTRDDVALETDQSKLVIEVQTLQQESTAPTAENTQYVWITGLGENEVSSSVSSSSTSATAAVTTESAAAQAVKTEARESTSAAELEQLEEAATRYAGGIGTEQKPYLIKNEEHLNSLKEDVSAGETDGRHYKLIDNLALDNFVMIGSAFTPDTSTGRGSYEINPVSTFKGTLDGNNKIITYTLIINDIVTTYCGAGFFSNITDATIKNVTFNVTLNCSASTIFIGGVTGFALGDCNFENVTVNGNITAAWDVGGFIGATDDFGSGEFKNCVNNATIVANTLRTSGYSPTGGFIGQANALNSSGVLTFTNCQNNGSITVNQPQGKAATVSHFIGFVSDTHPETYNFNNCTVGQNASINVAFGQTRTKGNKTIYCAYTPSAEAIVPVIKYVGITNNTYDGKPAVAVINVDGQAQDLSRYVVE